MKHLQEEGAVSPAAAPWASGRCDRLARKNREELDECRAQRAEGPRRHLAHQWDRS